VDLAVTGKVKAREARPAKQVPSSSLFP